MGRITLYSIFVLLLSTGAAQAADTPIIDPAKAAQLQRLEPLSGDKIDIFVESGQLTQAQADYVKRHIGPGGKLALPDAAIAAEPPRVPATATVRNVQPAASAPTEAGTLPAGDRDRLAAVIRDYRHGNRSAIARELRRFRPAVNDVIAAAYTDPIDLPVKVALWEEVAGPADPGAAIGLAETHRAAFNLARPVLIAYDKDAGGIIVRRLSRSADAGASPREQFFTSRELRDLVLRIEELIARCAGAEAATYLMDVYSQRYTEGEAPMRDKGRDRHRLVEACGGDPKKFDQDERATWGSSLSQQERLVIADRLIPYLHGGDDDRRKIARNGLMICLPRGHPDWEAGRAEWERWWAANRGG